MFRILITALVSALLAMPVIALTTPERLEGDTANASFGFGLRDLGDINDDGYPDFAVGAHKFTNGESEEGAIFLYLGTPSGPSTTAAWQYESNVEDARLGVALAAGDLNGDGIDDLAAGALGYDDAIRTGGAVLIFFGAPGGPAATPDQIIHSGQADALFGRGLAIPGDLDVDGYDDLAVGAPDFDTESTNGGRAFLFDGGPAGVAATPSWTVDGLTFDEQFGFELAGLGDVNGDGLPELGVTSRNGGSAVRDGHAEVFYGNSAGLSTVPSAILNLDAFEANTGWGIAGGDFDGDGFSDIALGAHTYNTAEHPGGVVAIFEGSPTGPASTPSVLLDDGQPDAQFGIAVASGKDLNGDGLDELLVGAQTHAESGNPGGAAFIFRGSEQGIDPVPNEQLTYGQPDARAGRRVELLGDLDGDGTADVGVSATRYTNDQTLEGAVFIHTGFSDFLFSDRFRESEAPQ